MTIAICLLIRGMGEEREESGEHTVLHVISALTSPRPSSTNTLKRMDGNSSSLPATESLAGCWEGAEGPPHPTSLVKVRGEGSRLSADGAPRQTKQINTDT